MTPRPPEDNPQVLVERSVPTDPGVRSSSSLFLSETEAQGLEATRTMLEVGSQPAPQHIAERMNASAGDPLFVRRRLMSVGRVPVRMATSYFTIPDAESLGLDQPDFVPGGLQELFERAGKSFGRAVETLVARAATAEEAKILDLEPGAPVVEVLRTSYDADGVPVHTLETICAADKHIFRVRQVGGDTSF